MRKPISSKAVIVIPVAVFIKTMILIAVFPKDIILFQIMILIDVLSNAILLKAVTS